MSPFLLSTLSRVIVEKNLVDTDTDRSTELFRKFNRGLFRGVFDFTVHITGNTEFFRHFALGKTSVLAGLFYCKAQSGHLTFS